MLSIATLLAMSLTTFSAQSQLQKQDVVWTTPSKDAAGSMPIGNGEVVLNVWVEEATGDLVFYVARTDAVSEISRYLKLGRVRVHFESSPFKNAKNFQHKLNLFDGRIEVSAGKNRVSLFVDSGAPVIHIEGAFEKATGVTATVENWRDKPRELPKDEGRSAWTVQGAPFPLVESADVFMPFEAVVWYHRNETSVASKLWDNQSLNGLPGLFDPLIHRTFGGRLEGEGFEKRDDHTMGAAPRSKFQLQVTTHTAQTETVPEWLSGLMDQRAKSASLAEAGARTRKWWHEFWDRSWVFVDGDLGGYPVPENKHPLRKGVDSGGGNVFPGDISRWEFVPKSLPWVDINAWLDGDLQRFKSGEGEQVDTSKGFTLMAKITPKELKPGRIFDKVTAGVDDGFLFDMQPGGTLRLIVGSVHLEAPNSLKAGVEQKVAATYDTKTGEAAIYLDGKKVASRARANGSAITRGYVLQRYAQACQGRGEFPIKFNGGFYTVEPAAMGMKFNPDWRQWGDAQWFQNVRHMYHPMLESGDWEMMEPFFRLYERVRPLAESRSRLYYGAEGAYFPETMSAFGTYSGGDYGWERAGKKPGDVDSPWWRWAWNQGPELVGLMLDRWDYSRDEEFLKKRVLPMAESVLKYFDTRFKKDEAGRVVLDPAQVVETYWEGVVNDLPTTAGLISITSRLSALPSSLVSPSQKAFFAHMKAACPQLPFQTTAEERELAPAEKYVNKTSNVENAELYAVWPFRVVTFMHPTHLAEAKLSYAHRKNRLDNGWGYDGNAAALMGMTDEAARILRAKCANSNPAYRWPATWGPNFDWLPDQNHGGNLLKTTQLMLLQADSLEDGGAIRVLPAWPLKWNVSFKLRAPGRTTVECEYRDGRFVRLIVTPEARAQDLVLPVGR